MEAILKSQKIPIFEGKKEKFAHWSYTFLSVCMLVQCKEVLLDDNYGVPKSTDTLDPEDDAEEIIKRKANNTAYALLTITIKDSTGFQAVRSATTKDLPDGCARTAWKNLIRIYQPKSNTQKFELIQQFNDCKLEKETKNPDEWFTELEHIRALLYDDHKEQIEDEKMIQQIVFNIKPKCYDTAVYALKRDLEYDKNKLTLDRVKDEIRQAYGHNNKGKTPETALSAGQSGKKKFKGECRLCGAKGHKATDCWDNDKNKDKRPKWYKSPDQRKKNSETANSAGSNNNNRSGNNGNSTNSNNTANSATGRKTCGFCGKDNHLEDNCIKKMREQLQKLQGDSQNSNNSGNGHTANPVMLLCYDTCMLTSDSDSLVNMNTFIADSGASTHMVHSKHLLKNFQEDLGEVKIGDNTKVESLGKGTFYGYHLNKNGTEVPVILTDVLLVPSLWVNLFSVTKATTDNKAKIICEDNLITVQPTNSGNIC
jgi:gag-polypeptide of LTR copia-type